MLTIRLLILFVSFFTFLCNATAQVERVIYCDDTNYNLSVSTSFGLPTNGVIVDSNLNVYLVVKKEKYDPLACCDDRITSVPIIDSILLYKIDSSGTPLWKKNLDSDVSNNSIFFKKDSVLVAYSNLTKNAEMPNASPLKGKIYNFTCNKDYYVVSYHSDSGAWQNTKYYTVVYDKVGNIISFLRSSYYNAIEIGNDNVIYAIPDKKRTKGIRDSNVVPLTLVKMDIFQNVLSEKHLAALAVKDLNFLFTTNNELIIIGTEYPNSFNPSGLYYYREKL